MNIEKIQLMLEKISNGKYIDNINIIKHLYHHINNIRNPDIIYEDKNKDGIVLTWLVTHKTYLDIHIKNNFAKYYITYINEDENDIRTIAFGNFDISNSDDIGYLENFMYTRKYNFFR